jgi:hypothetical protein
MGWYLVESGDYTIEHGGRESAGVVAESKASETIYLHVITLTDAEIDKLGAPTDEHGNKRHDRLALPRNEAWWVAIEGEAFWPKLYRPRIASRCAEQGGRYRPVPLPEEDLKRLRQAGVKGI